MKNEIQSLTLPKIKLLLSIRLFSMLLFILFTVLTVASLFGTQVLRWPWAGSLLAAVICMIFAAASHAGFWFLNNKLSSGGL